MTTVEAATTTQQEATERVRRRTSQRHQKIEAITTGQLLLADEPLPIASRIERLSRYYPSVRPVSPAALVANDPEAVQAAGQCSRTSTQSSWAITSLSNVSGRRQNGRQ